jgi:hypothetical protein
MFGSALALAAKLVMITTSNEMKTSQVLLWLPSSEPLIGPFGHENKALTVQEPRMRSGRRRWPCYQHADCEEA